MIDFSSTLDTIPTLNGEEIIKEVTYAQYTDADVFQKILNWVFGTYQISDNRLIDIGERFLLNDTISEEFVDYWKQKFPLFVAEPTKEYVARLRNILSNNRVGTYDYIKHFLFNIGDENGPFKKVLFVLEDPKFYAILDTEDEALLDFSDRALLDATSGAQFDIDEHHNRIKMITDREVDQKIIDNIIPACSTIKDGAPIVHDHFTYGISHLGGPDTLG